MNFLTQTQLADATGYTYQTITNRRGELARMGLSFEIGGKTYFYPIAVAHLNARKHREMSRRIARAMRLDPARVFFGCVDGRRGYYAGEKFLGRSAKKILEMLKGGADE